MTTLLVAGLLAGCPSDPDPDENAGDTGGSDTSMMADAGDDSGGSDVGPDAAMPDGGGDMDAGDGGDMDGDGGMMDGGDGGMMDGGDGGDTGPEDFQTCREIQPPSDGSLCTVQAGDPDKILLVGDVLTSETIYDNGAVLIDRSGEADNATISCAGCGCEQQAGSPAPTVVTCPEAVISPGLINPHDHLGWAKYGPIDNGDTRYDHRNEWRRGKNGKMSINTPGSDYDDAAILYGELRHLLGGATSIAGSSRNSSDLGLLRNLDNSRSTGGIDVSVDYSTFPLGDSDGTMRTDSCNYPRIESYGVLSEDIFLPHISEGIDEAAQNEFNCLSKHGEDARDLTAENTSVIHGVGMTASDIRSLAADGGHLVWSPRTNISLYGHTADVLTYRHFGVPISLGTDWPISGSMNMLRELACVDYLNNNHYGGRLSNREIWQMATYNGAVALGVEDKLGKLAKGYIADIAIFDARQSSNYRAVIAANNSDVHLVMRGGEPLAGDTSIVEALVPMSERDQCESLEMCGQQRSVCVARDTADGRDNPLTLADLRQAADSEAYDLFSCDPSTLTEPTCVPSRPMQYDGMSSMDDPDADGVANAEDNCPNHFNPPRPMADGKQLDGDEDGRGNPCDPCPTSKDNMCDPNDYDDDGTPNDMDNCPWEPNRVQADGDGDGVGDVCDNSTTIRDIHNGAHPAGERIRLDQVVVTAQGPEGVFVQVPPGSTRWQGSAKSGMFVFLGGGDLPKRGDHIDVEGRVVDYYGLTQISAVTDLEILSSGNSLPQPETLSPCDIATGGPKADDYIGALVRVENITVTNANPDDPKDYGEFAVGDCMGSDGLRVDDAIHEIKPDPQVGDGFQAIQGPLYYAFSNTKLEPRDAMDVFFGPADLKTIEPATSYIKAGTTGVPSPNFEVVLNRPSAQPTTVNLTYKNPAMLDGPATVTVPANQTRAQVMLNAKQAAANPTDFAVVEASVSGGMPQTADVLVYDDQLTRTLTDFSTKTQFAQPGQNFTVTATLDLPAPSGGATVQLSSMSDLGLPGPSVTIPADSFETTFQVAAGMATTKKTLTGTLGQTSKSLSVTVQKGPVGDCLIISEYIEGGGFNNKAIELYNCGATTLNLGDFGVCLFSNSNATCSGPAMLKAPAGGSAQLQPGEVHTLCKSAPSSGPYGDPVEKIAKNCKQEAPNVMNHNGNDRLMIFEDKNADGNYKEGVDVIVDSLGQPKVAPSSSPWKDETLRRCDFSPYQGMGPFKKSDYYTQHPKDDASDYGKAPMTMGCPTP